MAAHVPFGEVPVSPVTALGIRDGDPDALEALVDLRGGAVLAYCERACPPGLAAEAAAEAFARFRATVVAVDRPTELDPELALLSATRHAAARRAPRPQAPPAGTLGRLLGAKSSVDQVAMVPLLLAARADGALLPADEERLNRLLDASASARAVEERFRAAELAYRSAGHRPVPEGIADQIVTAMIAVPAALDDVEAVGSVAAAAAGAPVGATAMPPATADPADFDPPSPAEPTPPPAPPEPEPDFAPPPSPAGPGAPAANGEVPLDAADDSADPVPLDADSLTSAADQVAAASEPPEADRIVSASGAVETGEDVGAVEDAALTGDELGETVEWHLPPEELGPEGTLDTEIAAARLQSPPPDAPATPGGAVRAPRPEDEQDVRTIGGGPAPRRGQTADAPRIVAEVASQLPAAAAAAAAKAKRAATTAAGPSGRRAGADAAPPPGSDPGGMGRSLPRLPADRPAIPGRGALAPAAVVIAIAAIGAMGAAGVFGGNDPSPPVDTGIVPPRALVAVPEGEAAAIVDDLRDAAARARAQRLSEAQQRALAASEAARAQSATEGTDDEDAGGTDDTAPAPEAPEQPQDEGTAPGAEAPADEADPSVEGEVGGTGATTP
jgi:hypothetical protein